MKKFMHSMFGANTRINRTNKSLTLLEDLGLQWDIVWVVLHLVQEATTKDTNQSTFL
jgi:hypothetical protein